jgi:hypothetical protein
MVPLNRCEAHAWSVRTPVCHCAGADAPWRRPLQPAEGRPVAFSARHAPQVARLAAITAGLTALVVRSAVAGLASTMHFDEST